MNPFEVTIMVKINGKEEEVVGQSISEYLSNANYDPRTIVIEINEEIISKNQYDDTIIRDSDIIEIISFMGGGASWTIN